jgi:hypothetical protein
MINKIPGINFQTRKHSEALLQGTFTISIKDAMDLCAETRSGLAQNVPFNEQFIAQLKESLLKQLQDIQNERNS